MLTEAEQNRYIIENMELAQNIASTHRHPQIPQEEIDAEASAGLVEAARIWRGEGHFIPFAIKVISNNLVHFTKNWQKLETVGRQTEDEIERFWFEWSKFFVVPYETWTSLAATPEDLVVEFESMRQSHAALSGAMIGLSKRERDMIRARFIDKPNKTLVHIAHDHRISYARVVYIIKRALGKMAAVLNNLENKSATAA